MSDKNRYSLPGTTSASVVIGLCCQTSKKWKLFLQDGPYWNYIAKQVEKKHYFQGYDTRIDDVVNMTIAKVAKYLASGRFVYKAAGQGYFRAFLKMVTSHVALDALRKERRYLAEAGTKERLTSEERELLAEESVDSTAETRTLDEYDASSEVNADLKSGRRKGCAACLISIDDLRGVFDDSKDGAFDPASMQRYMQESASEEQAFLKRVQMNVFNLALVSVLSDDTVPVARRELLNMLYVGKMTSGEIYELEDYKNLKRGTFDKKVFDAKHELVKPILEFWKAVAPESCVDSEEKLRGLWCALLTKPKTRKRAKMTLKFLDMHGEAPEGMKI